jgi:photosystem II stability/assembly factor-like uncharacterized protein
MKKLLSSLLLAAIAFAPHADAQTGKKQDAPAIWTDYYSSRDMLEMNCMFFRDAQNGWVGGPEGIVHTSDGGKTWERQYSSRGKINCIYFKNATDGYAVGYQQLYLETHDGGANWNTHYTITDMNAYYNIFFTDDRTGYLMASDKAYKSIDGGKTWKRMEIDIPAERQSNEFRSMTFRDSKHGYIVGDGEMLYTTDDAGATWTLNKKDFFTGNRRRFYCVAFANANTGWITCADEGGGDAVDCLYTSDGGATWTPKKVFNSYLVKSFVFHGNCGTAFYGGMNPHTIMVTTDGGATWNEQTVIEKGKVFAAEVFAPGVGFAGAMDYSFLFHIYVPKQ